MFICIKLLTLLIHSYTINPQTDRNAASVFRSVAVKRQIVPVLAGKKVPLFKCAILSCCSWNRWVIKLDWARSPTLQSAGCLWYESGRLSHNHLLIGRFASLQQSFFGVFLRDRFCSNCSFWLDIKKIKKRSGCSLVLKSWSSSCF